MPRFTHPDRAALFRDLVARTAARKSSRPFAANVTGLTTADPFTWWLGVCPVCGGPLSLFSTSPDIDPDDGDHGTRVVCKTTNCAPADLASALAIPDDLAEFVDLPIPSLWLPNVYDVPPVTRAGIFADVIPFNALTFDLPEFLVTDLIHKGTHTAIIGPRSTGKSFVALDLALSLTLGRPFFGLPTSQAAVLYVAAEGILGMRARVDAWVDYHGVDPVDLGDSVFFPAPINLTRPDERTAFLDAFKASPFDVVVLDTFARVTSGLDENSRQAMDGFVDVLNEIHRISPTTTTVTIHHPNSQGAARGSSSFEGALDLILSLSGSIDALSVTKSKAKYLPDGPLFDLERAPREDLPAPVLIRYEDNVGALSSDDRSLITLFVVLTTTLVGPYAGGFKDSEARAALRLLPTRNGTPSASAVTRRLQSLKNRGLVIPFDASDDPNDPDQPDAATLGKATRWRLHGPTLDRIRALVDGRTPEVLGLVGTVTSGADDAPDVVAADPEAADLADRMTP